MAINITHTKGLVCAPFTAMNPDCGINLGAIEKQANFMYGNGVVGVFICGTTGESMSLTVQERKNIAERWHQAYFYNGCWHQQNFSNEVEETYYLLAALPPNHTAEDVIAIMGTDIWVTLICAECGETRVRAVQFEEGDLICWSCINKARQMIMDLDLNAKDQY